MTQNKEHKGRLRDTEQTLYDGRKKFKDIIRSTPHASNTFDVKRDWGHVAPPEMKRKAKKGGTLKKLFVGSIIFFLIAIVFAAVVIFSGSNTVSPKNIEITVLGSSFTDGGDPLPIQIQILNKNSLPLETADLFLEYPDGSGEITRKIISLGTIGAGRSVTETTDIVLYGQQGDEKAITARLQYRVRGSNAIFVKDYAHPVTISSAPLLLTVSAPETVSSGQKYTFDIIVQSNGESAIEDIGLVIDYPSGFVFEKATPEPNLGDRVWALGDIGSGVQKKITITGKLLGVDGDERTFRTYTGQYTNQNQSELDSTFSSYAFTTGIVQPFIQAKIVLDGEDADEFVRQGRNTIRGDVQWVNNLPTRIDDVEIYLTLSGNALDKSSVQASSGFYDSNTDTARWTKETLQSLASVQPGDSGRVSFSLSSLPLFESGVMIQNPEAFLSVTIKGKQPQEGGALESVENSVERHISFASDLRLNAGSFYYTSPFANSGTIPPKAGSPTTYTIAWEISNSSNPVRDAKVKAVLPSYATFTGVVSPVGESISYNSTTREVTWNVGDVARGAGLVGPSKKAYFQVSVTPSLSQVGSQPLLVEASVLSGYDTFTRKVLEHTRGSLSTRTFNDPGFQDASSRVVAQ